RDEKKELLPAVLKALSDEETQSIVESIGDRRAEIDEEKRSEAEERRAAAQQVKAQADNVQQAAETVAATLWTGPRAVQKSAELAQDTARTGLGTMTEVAQRTSDQMMQTLNRTGEQAQEFARQSSQNFTVMTEAGNILARGFQDISQEWLGVMQAHVQRNFDGFTALARCRSISDYIALQNELVRDRLQHTIDGARRIADVSTRVADEATRTMSAQRPTGLARRAA
ncbi:MAG: phasin family protein, partial [Microvirga sp.]